jgi:septum formation inhibitor-activating ATPase MinD
MPMERIKQSLSDVVHNWTVIIMITLFLFTVQPGPTVSQALTTAPEKVQKTEKQLKREIINKFSNETYKHSEMLAAEDLKDLLWAVGFEGIALKTAWAVARVESNGRPLALNDNKSTGDKSYGIFQINMLGELGVDRLEKFNLVSNKELFDPVTNAEITYYMTKGGKDWSSWPNSIGKAKELINQFPKA